MTTDNIGGVWSFSVDLAAELRRRGHDVHMAIVGAALSPEQRDELQTLPGAWDHREARLEWMEDAGDDVAATGEWLRDIAARIRPDLIHFNDFAHARSAWECSVIVVAHSDVVTWWRAVHGKPPPPEWNAYRSAVEAALHAADVVVAPTSAMLDVLRESYAFSSATKVVPNAAPSVARLEPGKEPLVVAAGRVWDRAKNVAAVARVSQRLTWPLAIAGAGSPTGGDAEWLGHLPRHELRALFARASIFAEPALYEPFGLSALEAGMHACALVLADIASLREVWGDAAIYVDPLDDDALASALQSLIVDDQRREDLARRARSRALEYSIERTADAYLAIYDAVRDGSPAGPRRRAIV